MLNVARIGGSAATVCTLASATSREWRLIEGFRAHAAEGDLKDLAATFGEAHDFTRSGKRVYFSLPTTWKGLTLGKRFEEHGAWSFVLEQESIGWRIAGYGWGVTAYSEAPR